MPRLTSVTVTVRLRPEEAKMLNALSPSGAMNRSETIRVLIHREYNRCHSGTSKHSNQVFSEMRVGRPRQDPGLDPGLAATSAAQDNLDTVKASVTF